MCSIALDRAGLKSSSAKVAWRDVCSLKSEGGLGLRDLKEVNKYLGLS